MSEINQFDQFFINHFNIMATVVLLIVGYVKLVLSSKSNGTKLDKVLDENKNMSNLQHTMQLDISKQSIEMSNLKREVTEIKNDMRELNSINVRLAAVENQLKAS